MAGKFSKKCLERLNDDTLVARVQARDAAARLAFAVLVERYRGPLLRRCQARLGNRHDAEDALQETLFRAYRGFDKFRGEARVRTWLTAIADNQCASLAERRARYAIGGHLHQLIEMHEELRLRAHAADDDATRRLDEALGRAPRKDREILRLRFFQDMALEEIADVLNIGLSAAKMRLYRALERVEVRLDEPSAANNT